jgi:hypothetical protein
MAIAVYLPVPLCVALAVVVAKASGARDVNVGS